MTESFKTIQCTVLKRLKRFPLHASAAITLQLQRTVQPSVEMTYQKKLSQYNNSDVQIFDILVAVVKSIQVVTD